ncbi:carbohydrate-binding protein [Alicyclobacillus fastidiosus]|uniref:Carbohydrate-binding protein n=1 Tax=Alicyclobacillus fastidiosus TaxID=392011 RepID=A0ABY6ZEQ2_9BACL|nr:carbohydrate-binding protein [Alicyclobacillus fastidiosus]WAH41326.1 carbohydrate-binding protein [Alicyclobacillus fastidiosus]
MNGRDQNTVSYAKTGSSSDWSTVWDEVYLPLGTDVIHFDSGNGSVSFGWLDVPSRGSTPDHGPVTTYQAENNIYADAQIVDEYNAENGEVVGDINNPDSYVNFNNVDVRRTGTYSITVRYDNGLGNCTDEVSVNGDSEVPLSLPSTGAWNTFNTVSFDTTLQQGENSILLRHGSNYAQIDDIVVSPVK